jgi:hypothetical protein
MTQVTFNGHEYSDDGSAARDMQGGGVRNWLLPMLSDAAVEINIAKAAQTYASQASTSASAASNWANQANAYAAAINGTSTSSITLGVGSKSLTTQTYKQFSAGQYVVIAYTSAPSTRMYGQVTSYTAATGALVVDVQLIYGAGTYSNWTIGVAGDRGVEGPPSRAYRAIKAAGYTVSAGDLGKLIECTATLTLSLSAAATMADGWFCYISNTGTGMVTIDPSGGELVDGAATISLPAGYSAMLQCDGSSWRSMWALPQINSSPTTAMTGDYSIDYTDRQIVCDPASGSQVITLPSAVPMLAGNGFAIINRHASNTLTIVDNTGAPLYRLPPLSAVDVGLQTAGTQEGAWLVTESPAPTPGGIVRSGAVTTLLASKVCHAVQALGGNMFLHVASGPTAGTLQFVVSTVSGLTITTGTAVTISGAVGAFVQLLPVTGGYVAIYANGAWSTLYAVAVTVSGTTVTAGTPVTLAAGSVYPDSAISPNIDCSTSGTTGVAVYASSSTTVAAVAFSVSGTVITAGTPVTLYTTSGGVYTLWGGYYGSHSIKMLSAASALYAGFVSDGSTNHYHKACAMTISGTTITAGTVVDFATGSTYRSAARGLAATSGTQGLAVLVGYGNYNTYAVRLDVSGTTVTAGTISGALGQAYTAVSVGYRLRLPQIAGSYYLAAPGNGTNRGWIKTINNANPPTHFATQGGNSGLAEVLSATEILCFGGAAAETDCFIGDMAYAKRADSDVGAGTPTQINSCSPQAVSTGVREAVVFNGATCSAYVIKWSL